MTLRSKMLGTTLAAEAWTPAEIFVSGDKSKYISSKRKKSPPPP